MSFCLCQQIKEQFDDVNDLVVRKINVGGNELNVIFLSEMVDKNEISKQIIAPIMQHKEIFSFEQLQNEIVSAGEIEEVDKSKCFDEIMANKILVIFNNRILSVDLTKFPSRTPTEPPTSPNIYGPREGFVEDIKTNISLMRKRLPSTNLKIKQLQVGRETKTRVNLLYLSNIANIKIVKEIEKKICKIDIDGIVDSYYIADYLKTRPKSMFEQAGFQEKPDIVVAKMLEGRIAIIVDGSPIVITLPYMMFEDFQGSNDYYTNYVYVNMIRIIRTIGVLIATVIPGLYLSIRLYSYNVLPINYIITIANSTKNLPFTPTLEIIFILLLFQILYEVSLRLPQYLGLATSIVGALVLGDTGVKAGLISPPGVIIVAVSIMAIYTVPAQAAQMTVLRGIFVVLGAAIGILGIVGGIVYLINYLNSINIYDTPFLAPYSPQIQSDLKDALFKKPLIEMRERPKSMKQKNKTRIGDL